MRLTVQRAANPWYVNTLEPFTRRQEEAILPILERLGGGAVRNIKRETDTRAVVETTVTYAMWRGLLVLTLEPGIEVDVGRLVTCASGEKIHWETYVVDNLGPFYVEDDSGRISKWDRDLPSSIVCRPTSNHSILYLGGRPPIDQLCQKCFDYNRFSEDERMKIAFNINRCKRFAARCK